MFGSRGVDGMTDLATRPDAGGSSDDDETAVIDDVATRSGDAGETPPSEYEWAPAQPAPKKRRLWLWIGIPVAAVVLGLGAASMFLIAPGTSIAGVPVGFLTPGAAADAVQRQLASTTVVLTGSGGGAEVTGAELGVELDPATASEALRAAVPSMYTDPTDASIAFDAASATYVVTPAVDGQGIDVASVQTALTDAFASGAGTVEVAATAAAVPAEGTTSVADATAGILNGMLDRAGFYVGEERTVPIDRATFASWLTVTPAERGTFTITADPNAIQPSVDGLAAAVNRPPVDSTTIVNSSGKVLSTPTEGVVGRELGATDGIAKSFAEQIGTGNAAYPLPVTEVPFKTTSLARLLEVDLSEQRLYVKENGNVVDSWAISSGADVTPTFTGRYTIGYKTPVQTMNGYN